MSLRERSWNRRFQRAISPLPSFRKFGFVDEFDLDAGLSRHLLSVLPNLVPERLGNLRTVENPKPSFEEKRSLYFQQGGK